ncbi:hypothetical protein TNCV_2740461 [Trichonephila clavipes]|nr:hypothetical protein TNCV_2740461 [Trichonephila clavipes]
MTHARDQQYLSSRKLKVTLQFEIPKFQSPLKLFPIGGYILMLEGRHSILFEHVAVHVGLIQISFTKVRMAPFAVASTSVLMSSVNEKVSNHGSIPITIDCNVVAFIVFEEVRTNDSTSPSSVPNSQFFWM